MIEQIQPFAVKEQASVCREPDIFLTINTLFAADSARFKRFSVEYDQIVLDFSKHRIDQTILNSLVDLAQAQDLKRWIKTLFSSEQINYTEHRADALGSAFTSIEFRFFRSQSTGTATVGANVCFSG
jgi:glucose-6-phosphate isomerase